MQFSGQMKTKDTSESGNPTNSQSLDGLLALCRPVRQAPIVELGTKDRMFVMNK